MERRITPKSDREYLRELFKKTLDGTYAIPVFQRDYCWKKTQVVALFDSIVMGYPIGSLTFWESNEEKTYKTRDLLTDEIKDSPKPQYYILDGRQRITTIFGCLSKEQNKREEFRLFFNTIDCTFEYLKNKYNPPITTVPLCTIFDTFELLDRLSQIKDEIKDNKELADQCISNARELNAILQEYVVTEVVLQQCSLSQATVVFDRINTEGTKLDEIDKLKANLYTKDSGETINDYFDDIRKSLIPYGFEKIDSDLLIDCCYRFVGLKDYENNLKQLADKQKDFDLAKTDIKKCIVQTAKFLHDDCDVISYQLLPYSRQFVTLTWFFKDITNPTTEHLNELKKWFFYTTCNQSFLNSSLSNVRALMNGMAKYTESQKYIEPNSAVVPIDYQTIEIEDTFFNFRFSNKSALSNLLMIEQIYEYKKKSSIHVSDLTYYDHVRIGKLSVGYLPVLHSSDKHFLESIRTNPAELCMSADVYEKYCLSHKAILALVDNNFESFNVERKQILKEILTKMLIGMGIDVDVR